MDDQYAFHVGVLAYLYGYPLVDQFRTQHNAALAEGLPPLDPMRSLGFFEVLNTILRSDQPPALDASVLVELNAIGVGPDQVFDQAQLSPARKRGLERAVRDARQLLRAAADSEDILNQSLLAQAQAYQRATP